MAFRPTSAAVSVLLAATVVSFPAAGLRAQQGDDTEYTSEMAAGNSALQRRQFNDALKAFKRASGLKNKTDAAAHYGMARAYQGLEAHKNVIDSCTDGLQFVGDNQQMRVSLLNIRGLAGFALGRQNGDPRRLRDAELDFRAVLNLTDTHPIARYNLGVVLLRQGRDPEGIKELEAYVADAGRTPEAERARRMIANPRRARENFAPDFSFTSLEGEHIALEDLEGKVVLLDFWATWCPPCVAATPALKRLHKNFADQQFVMLGISADRDANAWRAYIAREQMVWPQYHDLPRRMAQLFGVTGYPTYIVIDHEGVVRSTRSGWGNGTDSWLHNEVRKYVKAANEAAARTSQSTPSAVTLR